LELSTLHFFVVATPVPTGADTNCTDVAIAVTVSRIRQLLNRQSAGIVTGDSRQQSALANGIMGSQQM
jgi:hypothetical protein